MTSTSHFDEVKLELNNLIDDWNSNRESEGYNIVQCLTKLSELFEKETEIFHKQNTDPFDDRHPIYTSPSGSLGKLLKILTKNDNFLDALIGTYLIPSRSDTSLHALREATARLLLVIMPGLDALSIFSGNYNSGVMSALYRWVIEGDETLRTYAAGILASAVEHQDINMHHTNDNATIVPILLKRLWNYIEPGRYPSDSNSPSTSTDRNNEDPLTSSTQTSDKKDNNVSSKIRKRKHSDDDSSKKVKSRRASEKVNNIPRISEPHVYADNTDVQNTSNTVEERLETPRKSNTLDQSTFTVDLVDVSECSNSSWADMAPVVIGHSFSLAPPLSPVTCQLYIINLLVPLGEYQDLLCHFIEYKAIDFIRHYLDKSNINNGLLTFSSMRLLASLLCHNKIATKFIEMNGVQRLLRVRRPSIGATGVSICLYYLAYNLDAMERVCHLPHKVLVDLVKYATWLLECSHDSGQCHAALFFNISFQFHIILKLFDQKNGLRYLLNMLSMLPMLRNETEQNPVREDEDSNRQTAKTACQALKKYFETHLSIKASIAKEMLKITHRAPSQPSNSSKTIDNDREAVLKNLDLLITSTAKLPSHFFTNWAPIQLFMKLDGAKLILKLVAIACEWNNFYGRADIVRFALDSLAVLTLSPKVQLQLCESLSLPPSFTQETGMSIVLGVAEGEAYLGFEPEAQKSALSVIINCVCGPQYKFDGAMGKVVNGTPQPRVVTQSIDEDRLKMWESVKTNNGIKILLHLLLDTQPMFQADDIRLLSCKALCGLSRCESVKQIMSKLPVFNSGQIQGLTKQPVMQGGKKHHAQFCKYVEELTERVSGKSTNLDLDLDSLRKAHIVSETIIRYDNKELLQLIHNHLVWSGLHSTAGVLAKEASLYVPSTSSTSLFSTGTPKSSHRPLGSSGDASFSSPFNKRISFSRGDQASGETPTMFPHNSLPLLPSSTPRRGKKFRFEINTSGDHVTNPSDLYKLTSNGKVTVMKRDDMVGGASGAASSSTLNAIVAGYLQNQHAQCKNPVVTVPEFSLIRPHYCPNPRFRVEASLNVGSRLMRRQISPRFGGKGGACCDRQFVYSRFRPHVAYRPPDEDKIPYTCCAFTPDDSNLILGNYQGDLVIRGVFSDNDQVMESVCQGPIVAVKPARDGNRVLVIEEGVWNNSCFLYSLQSTSIKLTYEGCYHVEFSKTAQDKVIGTKNTCATIFDAETGHKLQKLESSDLTSHYSSNRATFSPDDDLVLSDGLLWDIRASGSRPIHKFDKFNAAVSGVFHPQGLEVIINTEIWDLRNYHLLHTVPAIDQCSINFNSDGNIIYAAKVLNLIDIDDPDEDDLNSAWTTFMAIDSHFYRPISVTDTKHKIFDFAVDRKDNHVAVIERHNTQMEMFLERPSMSLCRLYEVGRRRGEDDEDEEEEGAQPDEDDDNNEDDDLGDDDNFDDHDSDTTDDFMLSSSSFSSEASSRRRRRPRRRRRGGPSGVRARAGGGGGREESNQSHNSEDEEWSTLSDDSLTLNDGDGSDLDTDAMSDAIHAALGSSDND